MKEYTLLEIAEALSLDKGKVRRTITKLELIALNEETREHVNSPKLYDKEALELVAEENNITLKEDTKPRLKDSQDSKEVIELLKAQLEEDRLTKQKLEEKHAKELEDLKADKKRLEIKLDQAEERHAKQLEETNQLVKDAQQLVNQQQRLSLQANQKIELLENKIKEVIEPEAEEETSKTKRNIFSIFKR